MSTNSNLLPDSDKKWFLPYQRDWITDTSSLKIMEKSRQVGISFADAYHSVRIASSVTARYDVYVSTRDKFQSRLYIQDCKDWAEVLELVLVDLGEILLDKENNTSAFVLQFSNGNEARLAAWTRSAEPRTVTVPPAAAPPGKYRVVGHTGEVLPPIESTADGLKLTLTDAPQYLVRE